ncbi:MAG: alpha/beta hydrolase [Pseudomonadota bacterium]
MQHFTASDGRKIAFSDSGGSGPAVLCLAGLTRDSRDFAPLSPHLTPDFRVITMDYRGRGASDHATDPVTEYQPQIEGRDAVELLAHLGIERTSLIGTSRGGMIGMGLAASMPNLIGALVLNDIGPVIDLDGIGVIMTYLGKPIPHTDLDAAAAAFLALYGDTAPDLTLSDWRGYAERTFHMRDGRPVLSYDPALRGAVEASIPDAPPDLWPLFDAINAPLLILRGENSNILSADTVAEMQRRKPNLTAVEVPNRGHCPMLDEPAVLEAMLPFLRAHS